MRHGWDLNNTVDNIPGSSGLEHEHMMRGYAQGGRADPSGHNMRRKTASSNTYSRGPSSTNH